MNKSYFAIIPASVRYDRRLTPNAKLLYGEITALCNEKGYCWAHNSYFAELYEVSTRSISKWINQLIEYGYIFSEITYKDGKKEIEARKLKIINVETSIPPMEQKFHTPIEQNFHTPMEQKFADNNTYNNNTYNNNTHIPKLPLPKIYVSENLGTEKFDCQEVADAFNSRYLRIFLWFLVFLFSSTLQVP